MSQTDKPISWTCNSPDGCDNPWACTRFMRCRLPSPACQTESPRCLWTNGCNQPENCQREQRCMSDCLAARDAAEAAQKTDRQTEPLDLEAMASFVCDDMDVTLFRVAREAIILTALQQARESERAIIDAELAQPSDFTERFQKVVDERDQARAEVEHLEKMLGDWHHDDRPPSPGEWHMLCQEAHDMRACWDGACIEVQDAFQEGYRAANTDLSRSQAWDQSQALKNMNALTSKWRMPKGAK